MKNNLLIIIFSVFFFTNLLANEFKFETSEIEILKNGSLIKATNGKAISFNDNIEVVASSFEYYKELDILRSYNGLALVKSDNIQIKFEEIEIDQKKFFISTKGETEIIDNNENISLKSKFINYDINKKILMSNSKSILRDSSENIFSMGAFNYNKKKNILKIENLVLKDFENNNFKAELAFVNTKTQKLFGKDIEINLNNKSFDKDNEPRLKGRAVTNDKNFTEIKKGIFTTCKRNDNCPPWQLSAEEIKHDKKKTNYKLQKCFIKSL